MSKDGTANRIADLLGIKYAHAVRLIRTVNEGKTEPFGLPFSDLAHACRELMEQEAKTREAKNKKHAHSEYVSDECLCDPNMRVYCHSTECHGGSALEEGR